MGRLDRGTQPSYAKSNDRDAYVLSCAHLICTPHTNLVDSSVWVDLFFDFDTQHAIIHPKVKVVSSFINRFDDNIENRYAFCIYGY
mgnify:CR=1 FL=1